MTSTSPCIVRTALLPFHWTHLHPRLAQYSWFVPPTLDLMVTAPYTLGRWTRLASCCGHLDTSRPSETLPPRSAASTIYGHTTGATGWKEEIQPAIPPISTSSYWHFSFVEETFRYSKQEVNKDRPRPRVLLPPPSCPLPEGLDVATIVDQSPQPTAWVIVLWQLFILPP